MSDNDNQVRKASWGELLDFTHIFKSFMMVRQCFWQVFLALAAIALVHLAGSVMDWAWARTGSIARQEDVLMYYQAANKVEFDLNAQDRLAGLEAELSDLHKKSSNWSELEPFTAMFARNGGKLDGELFKAIRSILTENSKAAAKEESETKPAPENTDKMELSYNKLWEGYEANVSRVIKQSQRITDNASDIADDKIAEIKDKPVRKEAYKQLESDLIAAKRARWHLRVELIDSQRDKFLGRGIFSVLMTYEKDCFGRAVGAVRRGNIFSGFGRVLRRQSIIGRAYATKAPGVDVDFYVADNHNEPVGLLGWIFMMTQGILWLSGNFPVFAGIFCVATMAIWALFGGAITRIAAVYAARGECVTLSAAMKFAKSRFFSFLFAPLIPVLIILGCGVLMGLGGLLATVPLGDIATGVLFALPMILGCVIAFLSIGVVIGLPLMYPTIAAEGSESFDAISRSLHYPFTRPWRYGLYSLAAALYGAVCYLFVRLFVFIALLATHFFVANGFFGAGASSNPSPELADGAGKLDLLWTKPTLDSLVGPMNFAAMGFTDTLASFFIHLWVYLLAGLVAAFVICIAVNCFTQIYFLLRRRVDGADLDDVYITDENDDITPEPPASQDEVPETLIQEQDTEQTTAENTNDSENEEKDDIQA